RHADADDADDRGEADDRQQVLEVPEAVARGDRADGDEQQQCDAEAEVAAHRAAQEASREALVGFRGFGRRFRCGGGGGLVAHAATPSMMRSSTPCSSMSVAGEVCRTRRSAMTRTRSERPSTSSISLETTTMALPASARRRMRA